MYKEQRVLMGAIEREGLSYMQTQFINSYPTIVNIANPMTSRYRIYLNERDRKRSLSCE